MTSLHNTTRGGGVVEGINRPKHCLSNLLIRKKRDGESMNATTDDGQNAPEDKEIAQRRITLRTWI